MTLTPLHDHFENTPLGESSSVDDETFSQPTPQRKGWSVIKEVVETVIFVLLVFFIVRGLIQNFRIEGLSMSPTMHDQQYILVNKAVYMSFDLNAPLRLLPGKSDLPEHVIYPFHAPQRGDIVVFLAPDSAHDQPDKDYIKRVIATAGETVTIIDGKVYVNNNLLHETYLDPTMLTSCNGFQSTCTVTVPPDHLFVMGDNRPNSSDSRAWGPLPLRNVIGKAWISYWPRSDWGIIHAPSYGQ